MIGMNAIFHIASAIFLGGLFYYLVVTLKRLSLLQSLWQESWGGAPMRVYVGEPIAFLETLCAALGLSFDKAEQKRLVPQKIQTAEFFRALSTLGVEGLAFVGQDNGRPKVKVIRGERASEDASIKEALDRMNQAFADKFHFVVS